MGGCPDEAFLALVPKVSEALWERIIPAKLRFDYRPWHVGERLMRTPRPVVEHPIARRDFSLAGRVGIGNSVPFRATNYRNRVSPLSRVPKALR